MDSEAYFQLLRQCSLDDIHLTACSAQRLVDQAADLDPKLTLTEKGSFERRSPERYALNMTFTLTAPMRGQRRTGLKLQSTWQVLMDSSTPLPDEFLENYVNHNLAFNLWPSWRQWVLDASARMGLPPVLLPLRFPA